VTVCAEIIFSVPSNNLFKHTGWAKSKETKYFANIWAEIHVIVLILFKRCAAKSCTKSVRTNPYWLVLMVSPVFKMNRLHDVDLSYYIKYLEDFFILWTSRLAKMITSWYFFQKMHRRKRYKSYINNFLLQNEKSLKSI
jgi:hypothetical protein